MNYPRRKKVFQRAKASAKSIYRKNVEKYNVIVAYFKTWEKVIDKYGIKLKNQWNFNEIGFRIGVLTNNH